MNGFFRKHRTFTIGLCGLLLWIFCMHVLECDWILFWQRRNNLTDIVVRMFPPQWSYFPQILRPLIETLQMAVVGTAAGSFLALLAAPFGAVRMPVPKAVRRCLRILVQIFRSFSALILVLVATYIFGLGAFSGTLALGIYTFAIMTRLTYEDIEQASLRPFETLRCMGTGFLPAYCNGVIPMIASSYFSNVLYMLETNVRHSAVLGYIGAGGIGILLNETVAWRDYARTGMILILLFGTVALIEMISSFLTRVVTGRKTLSRRQKKVLIFFCAGIILVSLLTLEGPDLGHTNPTIIRNMVLGFIRPKMSFVLDFTRSGLLWLLFETVCISFAGTLIGAVLSLPLAFLGSGRLMPKTVCLPFRILVLVIRSVPFMIYGLIFIRNTGPGSFAGVLTLSLCSVGLLSKRFSQAIDSLDFRAYEALRQMGIPFLLRVRYAILPQLGGAFLQAVIYRFDVNIREASVLGMVGAGGIGATLVFSMNHYHWNEAGAVLIGLILLAWAADSLSGRNGRRN